MTEKTRNMILLTTIIVLIIGFIPFMTFINLKQQVSSLETELQTLKANHGFTQQKNQIESLQADVKMIQNDQAMMRFNQKRLIEVTESLLEIWLTDRSIEIP